MASHHQLELLEEDLKLIVLVVEVLVVPELLLEVVEVVLVVHWPEVMVEVEVH